MKKIINENFPGVEDVLPDSFDPATPGLHLVDVRRQEELTGELGKIKEAKWLFLDELQQRLNELPKHEPVIFVCRSGARSARATQYALGQGYTQVYNLHGGMLRWNELGLPSVKE